MHAFQWLDGVDVWQVAGWTMLHFLWTGALAGLIAGACRLVLRRASANARYVAALACLAVLATLPVGIGAWLAAKPQAMIVAENTATNTSSPSAPDSAGGLIGAVDGERPASVAPIVAREPALIPNTTAYPRPSPGLTEAIAGVTEYLPWLWIIGTPLTFVVLATGVVGAERLRRSSRAIHDGPIADACARLAKSLRIGRRATVAVCERIAAPVLVGILRPIILLPPAALTGWSPDEIEMVLLHELAHVRRWDNLVNLVQRIVESLLFFHPAIWLVSNWARREREACCDALVVGHTNQPQAYAELLVALAAQLPRSMLFHPAAASAMASGPLRGRVRRILKLEDDPMLVSGKSLGVVMSGLLLLVTLVVLNLPVRGQAKEAIDGATSSALAEVDDPTSVADALGEYRRAVVGYDLDFDSVFPDRGWVAFDAKRLQRYPTPDAWPDVLGHIDTDADKFRVVSERPAKKYETATAGNAYLVPLDWSVGTEGYATLLFLRGIAADAHVVAHSYTSFACFGKMAGDVLFKSYATALVQGDMPGQITCDSYFNLVVTGKFTGHLYAGTYAMIYLMGGFDGELELERSKVFIAGHTPRSALQRIKGAGKVYLEESDLAPGEHQIGSLLVTVKGKEVAALMGPMTVDEFTSNVANPASASPREAGALPSLNGLESVPVPFVVGASRFDDGDKITIQEVRGTAGAFEPGNLYWIKGTYTLGSRDRADLSVYTTAKDSANGNSPTWRIQTSVVDRGSGTFTLCLPMSYRGWPHVSFYPAEGGQSFGGVYFGTGDSVLKKWWASAGDVASNDNDSTRLEISERQPSNNEQPPKQPEPSVLVVYTLSNDQVPKLTAWLNATAKEKKNVKLIWGQNRSEWIIEATPTIQREIKNVINRIEPTRATNRFPSLEDQKLADLAYRRLGIELAPLNDDQLNRVKTLGYDGGLLVTTHGEPVVNWDEIRDDDLLVGLAIWPTTSLKAAGGVLNRDDIADLSPLKFYVVRNASTSEDGGKTYIIKDMIVSGRISVSLPNHRQGKISDETPSVVPTLPRVEAAAPVPIPLGSSDPRALEASRSSEKGVDELLASDPKLTTLNQQLMALQYRLLARDSGRSGEDSPSVEKLKSEIATIQQKIRAYREQVQQQLKNEPQNKSTLRYDGKSLDEWIELWQRELQYERRMQAIPALVAFAQHGYPQRVADVMLDTARQLRWQAFQDGGDNKTAEVRFCIALLLALTGQGADNSHVPLQATLPFAAEAARSNDPDLVAFADCFFTSLGVVRPDIDQIDELIALSRDDNLGKQGQMVDGAPLVRYKIMESLVNARGARPHEAIDARLREAIDSGTRPEQLLALRALYPLPDADADDAMKVATRKADALRYGMAATPSRDDAAERRERLAEAKELLSSDKAEVRIHGLQILRLLRPAAVDEVPEIAKHLLAEDQQERVVAVHVIRELTGSDQASIEYLRKQVGPKNSAELNTRCTQMLKSLEASSNSP